MTFSDFKVCLRIYEERKHMCYTPSLMNPTVYYIYIVVKTIIFPPRGRQILFVTSAIKKVHKAFQCWNKRRKDFCQNIKTYSNGQNYFFDLGYDIISDKSNLLVNCRATEHVINDKSKFY